MSESVDRLTGILVRGLRRLGELGEPETANQLAADAYSALRHDHPRAAQRLNGLMHHLVRLERTDEKEPLP